MELYQELRENWERLYWDEGYSKKHAQEHTNYESADDEDFSPYRLEFFSLLISYIYLFGIAIEVFVRRTRLSTVV